MSADLTSDAVGESGWERVRPDDVGPIVELARSDGSDLQLDALESSPRSASMARHGGPWPRPSCT